MWLQCGCFCGATSVVSTGSFDVSFELRFLCCGAGVEALEKPSDLPRVFGSSAPSGANLSAESRLSATEEMTTWQVHRSPSCSTFEMQPSAPNSKKSLAALCQAYHCRLYPLTIPCNSAILHSITLNLPLLSFTQLLSLSLFISLSFQSFHFFPHVWSPGSAANNPALIQDLKLLARHKSFRPHI